MSSSTDQLRSLIADEALPLAERKQAAEYYITAIRDVVSEPAEDDPAVTYLFAPETVPDTDSHSEMMNNLLLYAWKLIN